MSAARRAFAANFVAKITAVLKDSATAKSAAILANPALLAAAINKAAASLNVTGFTPVNASQMVVTAATVVDDVTTTSSSSSKTKLIIGLVVGIGGFVLLVAIGAAIYMSMQKGGEQSSGGPSAYDKGRFATRNATWSSCPRSCPCVINSVARWRPCLLLIVC